jgi:hypothetical protein
MVTEASSGRETTYHDSQGQRLRAVADGLFVFTTPSGEVYAQLTLHDHLQVHPLKSRVIRGWLITTYQDLYGSPPNGTAVENTLAALEGRAILQDERREVHVRLAKLDDALYLDLGNARWEAAKVTTQGWSVVAQPPVLFRRPKGALALPAPTRGGSLEAVCGVSRRPDNVLFGIRWGGVLP